MKGHNLYEFGDFVLDTSERQLRRDDEVISIQPKAFATLCLLVENQGKLLTKDFMMNELWADTFVEERNLAQNIFSLRKSLGKDKNGLKFIETVPKQGYRFVAEVRPLDEFEEDEIVEVSLSQKTTISAIGDFSDAELAEAVRATSESLTINQNQTYNELKQIETPQKSHFFSKFSPVSMFAIALISLLSIGATIWFWKYSNTESSKSSNPLANVKILNTTLKRLTNSGNAWNPAVSPDNKQIAYVYHDKNKDSLRLQNLATGSVTEVVPPTDGSFGLPVFSADGNYIFYSVRNGGNEGTILKTPIYGGSQQQIMTNTRSEIAISRDGEWLSFVRYDGKIDEYQLMVCRTNGTDERILKIHKGADSFVVWGTSPAWSFNGKKVAAISYNPLTEESKERVFFIAEIDFETGHERKIAVPTIGQVQNLAWLQDGEHLVVTAQDKESDTFQLWKIHRTNGEVKRITNDLNGYSRLSVSADGNFLLTNERTEANNLAIVDVASGSMLEELTSDTTLLNGYYGVMWTPDSKEIVYAQTNSVANGNIWKYDLVTKQAKQITFDKRKHNWWAVVTPDGKSIYFTSSRNDTLHIWKMDTDGSDPQQVTKGEAKLHSEVSPDGKWLIYASKNFLSKQPINGGEPINIMKGGGASQPSPDSKQIVFHYFDPNEKNKNPWKTGLKSFDDLTKLENIDIDPAHAIYRWKPDLTGFYYISAGRNQNNIFFYSLKDKTSTQITHFEDESIVNISVSPDGTKIAISKGKAKSEIIKITNFND